MIQSLSIALSALASITGIRTAGEIVADYSDYQNIAQIIDTSIITDDEGELTLNNVNYIDDLYAINGSNRYLEISFKNGYLIYDKLLNKKVEENHFIDSPFFNLNGAFKVYVPNNDNPGYLYFDGTDFISIAKRRNAIGMPLFQDITPSEDARFIADSFFFENLGGGHGTNYDNICGIVASEILLNYCDTFYNDNIIEEQYEITSREYNASANLIDFGSSPATGDCADKENEDKRFLEHLVDVFEECHHFSPVGIGTSSSEEMSYIQYYLDARNIEYTLYPYNFNFGTLIRDEFDVFIKEQIDLGRPVVTGGLGHAVVAYGYDDDYVFVHSGYGYVAATPWSTFKSQGLFDFNNDRGSYSLEIHNHIHSDNYYSSFHNRYYCPCGADMIEFSLKPLDWNFDPQYYFYEKHQEHHIGDISIITDRLRCGFIEEETINLSPRRQGAGRSYFKITLASNYNIVKCEIDMSWWSNTENGQNGSANIWYKDMLNDNSYGPLFDLNNDITLSTDRTNMNHLSFLMPEESNGISISATNEGIGSRNSGRLSIGNITFKCIINPVYYLG